MLTRTAENGWKAMFSASRYSPRGTTGRMKRYDEERSLACLALSGTCCRAGRGTDVLSNAPHGYRVLLFDLLHQPRSESRGAGGLSAHFLPAGLRPDRRQLTPMDDGRGPLAERA